MTTKQEQKTEGRKHPGGRPTKFKEEFIEQAGELCRKKGYTDEGLAAHFNVSETTINNWKRGYLEFFESLKKGKDEFDAQVVEQSLLKRALGYRYTETTREPAIVSRRGVIDGEGIGEGESVEEAVERSLVIIKQVTKEVAPDVTAQIFWLKNRQPERWRDRKDIAMGGMVKLILEDEQPEDVKPSEKQKDIKFSLGDESTALEDE
jgi:transcriptional regulator with XRE-family HTH domain